MGIKLTSFIAENIMVFLYKAFVHPKDVTKLVTTRLHGSPKSRRYHISKLRGIFDRKEFYLFFWFAR